MQRECLSLWAPPPVPLPLRSQFQGLTGTVVSTCGGLASIGPESKELAAAIHSATKTTRKQALSMFHVQQEATNSGRGALCIPKGPPAG